MLQPFESQGPDSWKGGNRCPDVFSGELRSGFVADWCCCCNPCNYIRPRNSAGRLECRCHPRLMCVKFTPDLGSDPCCRIFTYPLFPTYKINGFPKWVGYNFGINLINDEHYSLRIQEGYWKLFYVDPVGAETLVNQKVLDHVNVTCFDSPDELIVTGLTLGFCTGTLSFSPLDMITVPFFDRFWERKEAQLDIQEDVTIPPVVLPEGVARCHCYEATKILAVSGRRHIDGPVECVHFAWREDMGDRWEYLPLGGNPTTDREVIYLRSDHYGNCYLEFDFEQSGLMTNDWADPPNTIGLDINEIREGMVAIESCACCIKPERSFATGNRYVDIHAGPCSQWDYLCGTCRCLPRKLCIFGSLDGIADIFFGEAVWDNNNGWDAGSFRLTLVENELGHCIIRAEGIDLNDSEEISCDFYISTEMFSDYNEEYNTGRNWIWIQSSICGDCLVSRCGECLQDCGAPPPVLYVTITLDVHDGLATDYIIRSCVYNTNVYFWQRWDLTNPTSPTVICGYVGYTGPQICGSDVFIYRVELIDFGSFPRVTREYVSGPLFDLYGPSGGFTITENLLINASFDIAECDPIYKEGDFDAPGGGNVGHCCIAVDELHRLAINMVVVE